MLTKYTWVVDLFQYSELVSQQSENKIETFRFVYYPSFGVQWVAKRRRQNQQREIFFYKGTEFYFTVPVNLYQQLLIQLCF